jgi:hypothetical protein
MLLQHEWIQYHRRTLRSSWTRAQGYHARGAGPAHESVTSVVERMLVSAEAGGDESPDAAALRGVVAAAGAGAGGRAAALYTSDAAAGPLATQTPPTLALQQDISGGLEAGTPGNGGGGANILLPMPPGPAAAAGAHGGLSRFADAAGPSPRGGEGGSMSMELSTSSLPPPPSSGGDALLQRRLSGAAAGGSSQVRGSDEGGLMARARLPAAAVRDQRQLQQQQQAMAAAAAAGSAAAGGSNGPGPQALSLSPRDKGGAGAGVPVVAGAAEPGNDWDGALGLFLARLQGGDSGAPTPTARLVHNGSNLSAWLDEGSGERPGGSGAFGRGGPGQLRLGNSGGGGWYVDSSGGAGGGSAGAGASFESSGSPLTGRWGGGGSAPPSGPLYGRTASSNSLADSASAASIGAGGGGGGGDGSAAESSFVIETKRKVGSLGATAWARPSGIGAPPEALFWWRPTLLSLAVVHR